MDLDVFRFIEVFEAMEEDRKKKMKENERISAGVSLFGRRSWC